MEGDNSSTKPHSAFGQTACIGRETVRFYSQWVPSDVKSKVARLLAKSLALECTIDLHSSSHFYEE